MMSTLLSGKGAREAKDAAQFIGVLLDSVTRLHQAHFMTTGTGSFAAHEALGEAYEELQDGADTLAESYMGSAQTGLEFPGIRSGAEEARAVYDYVNAHRSVMSDDSHIQNLIDEILDKLARSLFKLDRLA